MHEQRSDSAFRAAIAKEYLPIFHKWSQDESIDESAFQKRLKLESVTLLPEGGAEVYYDDDGMFGGHALIAHLKADGTVGHVEKFG